MSAAEAMRHATEAAAHVRDGELRAGDRAALVDLVRALGVHAVDLPEPFVCVAAVALRTLADGRRATGPDGPAARRRAAVAERAEAEANAIETADNVVVLRRSDEPDETA